jgi:arylsulfatase A-like enzyme
MRTPLIIRLPGQKGGRIERGLVSLVDVVPTLLDAFGLDIPANIQGRSLYPALATGASCGADAVFGEHSARIEPSKVGVAGRMIRTVTHKYCMYSTGEEEMYDLAADGNETTNLAALPAHAAGKAVLESRLREWMDRTGDPYPELPEFLRD